MEHEASKGVPMKVREDLVAKITGTECNLAVLHGAPNKPWDGIEVAGNFTKRISTPLRMT
jgi:hypothetical protein